MTNRRRPRLLWPLLLIGLGTVWLLQNFGLLPPNIWGMLVQLWPVFLVVLGIDMLIGRRSSDRTLISLILSSLLIVVALGWVMLRANQKEGRPPQPVLQTMDGIQRAEVTVRTTVADVDIYALGGTTALVEGQIVPGPVDDVRQTYRVTADDVAAAPPGGWPPGQGGVGKLELLQEQQTLFAPFRARADGRQAHWSLGLNADLRLALNVQTDIGMTNLNLTGLHLSALNLRSGAGPVFVVLPTQDFGLRARVATGDGDAVITLPPAMPARLTVSGGGGRVEVATRFGRIGDVYTLPDFTQEGAFIDLELTAGAGHVVVR